ncbi:MAG: hypothetical protein KDC98_07045 [Planctomycetes bacterium]|nr:hypothetical protein [Planctomycetota bacterium]
MSAPPEDQSDPDSEPPPRATAIAGGCFYTVLLLASVVWLMLRDRIALVRTAAVGEHGAAIAVATGLGVGMLGYWTYAYGLSRVRAFAAIGTQVRQLFGSMGEAAALALVVIGAVAEEMFFRLAVQDQIGLVGSVATYALLSTGAMGLRWLPVAALHATVLGSLMAQGFGLLATTTANAVMNYLVLRRMLTQ